MQRASAHRDSTGLTALSRDQSQEAIMSTQWWQNGLEPRKIDIFVGKICTLLPRQKGQSCHSTAGCGGSCSTALSHSSSCCFLNTKEWPGPARPWAPSGVWALWLQLFSNTGKKRQRAGIGPGLGHTARTGCRDGLPVLTGAWPCRGVSVSAGQASSVCAAGRC